MEDSDGDGDENGGGDGTRSAGCEVRACRVCVEASRAIVTMLGRDAWEIRFLIAGRWTSSISSSASWIGRPSTSSTVCGSTYIHPPRRDNYFHVLERTTQIENTGNVIINHPWPTLLYLICRHPMWHLASLDRVCRRNSTSRASRGRRIPAQTRRGASKTDRGGWH